MEYDENNVFARILRGEIPCRKVAETDHSLAFEDVNPHAPVHVLVVPKGPYVDWHHFTTQAEPHEVVDLYTLVGRLAGELDLERDGYRVVANSGRNGHQEVPHFHVHLLGGRDLG